MKIFYFITLISLAFASSISHSGNQLLNVERKNNSESYLNVNIEVINNNPIYSRVEEILSDPNFENFGNQDGGSRKIDNIYYSAAIKVLKEGLKSYDSIDVINKNILTKHHAVHIKDDNSIIASEGFWDIFDEAPTANKKDANKYYQVRIAESDTYRNPEFMPITGCLRNEGDSDGGSISTSYTMETGQHTGSKFSINFSILYSLTFKFAMGLKMSQSTTVGFTCKVKGDDKEVQMFINPTLVRLSGINMREVTSSKMPFRSALTYGAWEAMDNRTLPLPGRPVKRCVTDAQLLRCDMMDVKV